MPTITTDADLPRIYCYDTLGLLKAIQSGEQFMVIDYDDSKLAVVGLSAEQYLPAADPIPELLEIESLFPTNATNSPV